MYSNKQQVGAICALNANSPIARIKSLDALRGIAAIGILLFHLRVTPLYWAQGYLFVDFFFILSGFILTQRYVATGALDTPSGRSSFIWHRFIRLYPLHVAMLLGYLAFRVIIAEPDSNYDATSGLLNLLLLHAAGFYPLEATWDSASWSISVEFLTNLAFLGLCADRWSTAGRFLAAVAIYAFLIHTWGTFQYAGVPALFRGAAGFLLGSVTATWYAGIKGPLQACLTTRVLLTLLEASLVSTFLLMANRVAVPDILFVPVFVAIITIFSLDAGAISALMRLCRIHVWGTLSFAIYLVHPLVIAIAGAVGLNDFVTHDVFFPAILMLSIGAAIAAHVLVERPAFAYGRRIMTLPAEQRLTHVLACATLIGLVAVSLLVLV